VIVRNDKFLSAINKLADAIVNHEEVMVFGIFQPPCNTIFLPRDQKAGVITSRQAAIILPYLVVKRREHYARRHAILEA
jgi:hypothetical protein